MSDGVGESHRFPPIDGLHDRCCNISNERCRRAPLEFIKSPSPRCLSAKPASAFSSELSLHTYVLELLIYKDVIPRELFDIQIKVYTEVYLLGPTSYTHLNLTDVLKTHPPDRHSSPPSHRLFPHSSPDFCVLYLRKATGIKLSSISTGINWDQTGIECLIRAWSFPCSFLVFFWSTVLIPRLLSFLTFALYFFITLSSLTQFSRTFRSLCALCLAIAIVPRLVRGDLHSPPQSSPRFSTHPGFNTEEISPAYWHVSQSPRTSFLQSSLFQG
ncbi:hypothetical protein N7527_008806 [Penicillium freii]|nr:hypothetical protein N7527_008806 [Penicillium freii]